MSFNLSEISFPSEVFENIFFIKVTGLTFWTILEQILYITRLRFLQCAALLSLKLFNLSSIWLLGHFLAIAHRCQSIRWNKFWGECSLLFLIRDFDGEVATVNCSSNDDLTKRFILATSLSAASDFLIHYSITRHIILLLLAF